MCFENKCVLNLSGNLKTHLISAAFQPTSIHHLTIDLLDRSRFLRLLRPQYQTNMITNHRINVSDSENAQAVTVTSRDSGINSSSHDNEALALERHQQFANAFVTSVRSTHGFCGTHITTAMMTDDLDNEGHGGDEDDDEDDDNDDVPPLIGGSDDVSSLGSILDYLMVNQGNNQSKQKALDEDQSKCEMNSSASLQPLDVSKFFYGVKGRHVNYLAGEGYLKCNWWSTGEDESLDRE